MLQLTQALAHQSNLVARLIQENDGSLPESCEELTLANFQVIAAMKLAHGQCWLGKINYYNWNDEPIILWEYDGSDPSAGYGADFVLPSYSAELEAMIVARLTGPYEGTRDDMKKIAAIYKKIAELKGETMIWS